MAARPRLPRALSRGQRPPRTSSPRGFAPETDSTLSESTSYSSSSATDHRLICVNKQPIHVRLGCMLTPAIYNAVPIYGLRPKSDLEDVLELERQLGSINGKLGTQGRNHSFERGDMVSVKPSASQPFWYRGQIKTLVRSAQRGDMAVVYLVDYGEYTDKVPISLCVRKLPEKYVNEPRPLAIRVFLAGLRPVGLDMNYEIKTVNRVLTDEWSRASEDKVNELLAASNRHAVITEWSLDQVGCVHGTVELQCVDVSYPPSVNLHAFLVENDFGVYDKQTFISDVKSLPQVEETKRSVISICGDGIEPGSVLFDDSKDFTKLSDISETTLDTTADASKIADTTSGSSTGLGDTTEDDDNYENLFLWEIVEPLTKVETSVNSSSASSSNRIELYKNFLRGKRVRVPKEPEDEDYWASIRSNTSFGTTNPEMKATFVPAGIDPGKHLEEELKKVVGDGVGPKMLGDKTKEVVLPPSLDDDHDDWNDY